MELAFSKRECNRYVASTKDVARCSCGQTWAHHKGRGIDAGDGARRYPDEVWNPSRHTVASPTDAFGTIDFIGGIVSFIHQ